MAIVDYESAMRSSVKEFFPNDPELSVNEVWYLIREVKRAIKTEEDPNKMVHEFMEQRRAQLPSAT